MAMREGILCRVGAQENGTATTVKGGYWQEGSTRVPASAINASLFTHIFYAFAFIESNTSLLKPSANDVDIETFSQTVKKINPEVKTLISISASGPEFQEVMQTEQSRQAFINSSISLARSNGFDGLDLDYEFAQSQAEMDNFSSFIAEWRVAVNSESTTAPLLLTAAVYYKPVLANVGVGTYPVKSISENLDFVNIMCYDFHGSWDVTQTGANANLYDPDSNLSADFGITSWLEAGLPSEKAVLGLTLYGRSWVLKDQNEATGLNAPAVAAGPAQPISQEKGVFFYAEVATFIKEKSASVVTDGTLVTSYCHADNLWVSYENQVVITRKVFYAQSKNLRGYFFWAITQDDDLWSISYAGK
ncbi:hypothetical protein AXG93_1617s1040 [Marchantia polymorpha subsp. ruderalis]|uniref:GH18 domain-containing protein n=1 Tax=Marchantia polymorpha subsp. ruderalis TaxID=1480154 RepID=A0A176W6G0_MARPO|nr:hypothetical protein AXG93_1617s1040 [Marchantia polymorpha subsp. ruderalis]